MKDENPFKDKLFQHTLPVREEVWQAIEKKLPEKEDRKLPIFWFILFASTLIGGSLMLGYTRGDANPMQPIPVDSSKSITVHPDLSEVQTSGNAADIATAKVSAIEANLETQNQAGFTPTQGNHTSSANTTESIAASSNTRISKSTATTTLSEKTTVSKTEKTNGYKTTTRSTTSTGSISASMQPIATSASVTLAGTANATTTNTSLKNTTTNKTTHHYGNTANATTSPETETSGYYVTPAVQRHSRITNLLPGIDAAIDEEEAEDVLEAMRAIRPDPSCYKFSAKGGQYFFSADFFSGPGWSPRSFTDPGGDATLYSLARKSTESSLYAWSAGARFNMHLHNGFAIRLGILYDQAGDIFDYTDTLATRSITRIDSFFAADGTFLREETVRVLEFGTLIKRINNTYRHLDVPILLSYEMPLGRSTFMINGGPVFNLTSSHKGQILDPMLIPRSITPGQPNLLSAYKTSLGLSIYIGAGVVFPLTNHFAGVIEPRYLYRIKPVTIKSYPLEEHRHYAGMNIGLRYFFK